MDQLLVGRELGPSKISPPGNLEKEEQGTVFQKVCLLPFALPLLSSCCHNHLWGRKKEFQYFRGLLYKELPGGNVGNLIREPW